MPQNDYLIGRGSLKIAERSVTGFPLALVDVGECPQIELAPQVDYVDNKETRSAFARRDLHLPIGASMMLNITMKEKTAANLALLMGGEVVTIAGGAVSALAWPTGIAAGEQRRLPDLAISVSSLSIVDSAGTPATLVSGTNYTADLDRGVITFLNVTGFTQPFKASYTVAAGETITFLSNMGKEWYILAEILDISKRPNKKFNVEIYRGVFDQPQAVALKGEDVAQFQTVITALDDDLRNETPGDPFGRYGRWYPIGA